MLDRTCFSLVVPVFNEQENLPTLLTRCGEVLPALGFDSYELILVDDGSTDATPALLADAAARDTTLRVVTLTRNFGHQSAVTIGLGAARGSVIGVIDADLQDPPEVLADFVAALDDGADVAFGVRQARKESLPKRLCYLAFYRALRSAASIDIPLDSGDFCCMRGWVARRMAELPETRRFVRGLRAWVGGRQVGVPYERAARFAGAPKYTFRKLVGLAYDGLFSFSALPIKVMQFLGFCVSAFAAMIAFGYAVYWFFDHEAIPSGFTTLVVSIWFLAGVQLMFMGLLGEYVYRVFDETRRRPPAMTRPVENVQAIALSRTDLDHRRAA